MDAATWIACAAAVCSAFAAGANVWMAYTSRKLRERQIKRETLRKFVSSFYSPTEFTNALNELLVTFNDDSSVMAVRDKVRKALKGTLVEGCFPEEVDLDLDVLFQAMFKAADLEWKWDSKVMVHSRR